MTYSYNGLRIVASTRKEAIHKVISGKEMTNEEIFEKAMRGDKSILKLPKERLMIKNKYGETPVHWLAVRGVKEILKLDRKLLTVKDKCGNIPIHCLAMNGVKEVLKLPKELLMIHNKCGCTPFHYLAWTRVEIPDAYKQYI